MSAAAYTDCLLNKMHRLSHRLYSLKKIQNWKSDFPLNYANGTAIKPQYVIENIQALTHGDAIYATGVGQHQMWAAQFIRFNEPNSWVSSGGLGTMGFGLPAAIGAKIARPEKEVWLIDGDGSNERTGHPELGPARENLPEYLMPSEHGWAKFSFLPVLGEGEEYSRDSLNKVLKIWEKNSCDYIDPVEKKPDSIDSAL